MTPTQVTKIYSQWWTRAFLKWNVNENPAFTPEDHTIQSEKVLTMFVQQGHSLEEASKWEVKQQ